MLCPWYDLQHTRRMSTQFLFFSHWKSQSRVRLTYITEPGPRITILSREIWSCHWWTHWRRANLKHKYVDAILMKTYIFGSTYMSKLFLLRHAPGRGLIKENTQSLGSLVWQVRLGLFYPELTLASCQNHENNLQLPNPWALSLYHLPKHSILEKYYRYDRAEREVAGAWTG